MIHYEFSKTWFKKHQILIKSGMINPENLERCFESVSETAAMISVLYVISGENHARVARKGR